MLTSLLFGTAKAPVSPVTRSVRQMHLAAKPITEPLPATDKKRAALIMARAARQAKIDAANAVPAKHYKTAGKRTQRAYDYMRKVYPRWISSEELIAETMIDKATVSTILFRMTTRGHLDKMKAVGSGRARTKLYRLVME